MDSFPLSLAEGPDSSTYMYLRLWIMFQSHAILWAPSAPTEVSVTHFKVYTSLCRHSSSLYPSVLFTTGRIFPSSWLFSLYSHSISCYPLCSLTVCCSPFSHRCTGHVQSVWISLLSLTHNKNLTLNHTMERSFQWFPYCIPCTQEEPPPTKIWCQFFY